MNILQKTTIALIASTLSFAAFADVEYKLGTNYYSMSIEGTTDDASSVELTAEINKKYIFEFEYLLDHEIAGMKTDNIMALAVTNRISQSKRFAYLLGGKVVSSSGDFPSTSIAARGGLEYSPYKNIRMDSSLYLKYIDTKIDNISDTALNVDANLYYSPVKHIELNLSYTIGLDDNYSATGIGVAYRF